MNKQKKLIIAGSILFLVVLVGYFFLKQSNSSVLVSDDNKTNDVAEDSGTNVFSSIEDALSKSVSLTCEFTDDEGVKTTSYIKNGTIRVTSYAPGQTITSSEAIIGDDYVKVWDSEKNEGYVFNVVDTAEEDDSLSMNKDSIMAQLNEYKDYCKTSVVPDSVFEVPDGVSFTDMNNFMNGINLPEEVEE